MRVGPMKHLGSIEEYVETTDSVGGVVKTWSLFSKVWCSISPLRGDERYVSAEKHATATHKVTTRYIAGVNPKMRLVVRGRTFEIISALNIGERDKTMQLVVKEDADDD